MPTDDYKRFSWEIADHVCRVCLGRVLKRRMIGGGRAFRCANCGTEVESRNVASLCCCGMRLRSGRDAGVRCLVNPSRTPECPNEIVAAAADLPPGVQSADPSGYPADEPAESHKIEQGYYDGHISGFGGTVDAR